MLKDSELIINPDGSIYHLNLFPSDIANTIILVGDPDRVSTVSQFFDSIEIKKQKREFVTHTGFLNGKRLTVISTGIGAPNIDIVLNELDALANIDFQTRVIKKNLTSLRLIRIGTSGSFSKKFPIDSFLLSKSSLGFDGMMNFYSNNSETTLLNKAKEKFRQSPYVSMIYDACADESLVSVFKGLAEEGNTATLPGFYAAQGRELRIEHMQNQFFEKLKELNFHNLEMETAAIYYLSNLLGHKAISFNAILANREQKTFSKEPKKRITSLIQKVLSYTFSFCLIRFLIGFDLP